VLAAECPGWFQALDLNKKTTKEISPYFLIKNLNLNHNALNIKRSHKKMQLLQNIRSHN
jgi:hypothetical protein